MEFMWFAVSVGNLKSFAEVVFFVCHLGNHARLACKFRFWKWARGQAIGRPQGCASLALFVSYESRR